MRFQREILATIAFMALVVPLAVAQGGNEAPAALTILEFLKQNWSELVLGLFAFIEVIVRITPTQQDDSWFQWLRKIIDAVLPSRQSGGGNFKA